MDLPPIRNSPPKDDEENLPLFHKLLPRPDQDETLTYTIRDPFRGPILAPVQQPDAHSVLNALRNGKEPPLEPKIRTAVMTALDNFQVPGDSISKLVSNTSTSMKLDISSSTYQAMFSMDDTLAATICKIVNTNSRIPHVPHCGRANCKLLAGCDIAYNPYRDPLGVIRDKYGGREKAYEPYISPFQQEVIVHSPKKRKLSDNTDKYSEDKLVNSSSTLFEPTGPFSEMSWLAIELFLIMNWTNPDCPGHIIVEGLLKIIPGLNLKECLALDLLRVTYSVPNIYDDDDEDESTEGAKIHKLHEKVWHMPPAYLTPRMNEIYWRLMQLGHIPDLVLMPPSKDWNSSLEMVSLIDEPGYNYCFVGGDNKLYYISARFTMKGMEPTQLQISLEEYREDEQRRLKKRNNARNLYYDRLEMHDIRNQAAMEAIRMVHELRCDPSTNSRIQVEVVRLNYEKRGLPWHWKFSPTIGQIEPAVFAHWVDKLDNKEFAYALTPLQDWAIAGVKLGKALKSGRDTYTSTTNGHVADNPMKAAVGGLSPGKRPYSEVSWDSEDEEIPSNSTPPDEADILRFEQQRMIGLTGMTEDDLLKQVLEQSMKDVDGDSHIKGCTSVKQTPVPVVPEVTDEQPEDSMSIDEIDELMELSFEWGLSMSCNPKLGPFPKKKVADEIKSKRPQHHASLTKSVPKLNVHLNCQVLNPLFEMSVPKTNIAAGGLDGVEEQLPLLTSLVSWPFPESFERASKSYPLPSNRTGSVKEDRIKVDYIADAVSNVQGNLPLATSSHSPYEEIVAKAAKDNGLIDMATYHRISNKNRDRSNSWMQKERSRRQAQEDAETLRRYLLIPLSPSARNITNTDREHAPEKEPYLKDGQHFPRPILSMTTTVNTEEPAQSENAVVVHVEEVDEDDNDESPRTQQRLPTEHDIALRTLTINKPMWLKEDAEYKRISSSEQSLSQHLAQNDVPLSCRSTAMVSVVIRDREQREDWILKKAGLKARILLPVLGASAPVLGFSAAGAAARAPSPSISLSSDDSMSSCATAQERDGEVGNVARDLAIAVNALSRPSVSSAASGTDLMTTQETGSLPVLEKTKSNETTMPIANMDLRGGGTWSLNSASDDHGISLGDRGVNVVRGIDGREMSSPSPVLNAVGSCHSSSKNIEVQLRDAMSEVRKTLGQVEVIPDSEGEDDAMETDKLVSDVEMVELLPEDIAKEA